jgi:type IV pilus assembly protein PilQ
MTALPLSGWSGQTAPAAGNTSTTAAVQNGGTVQLKVRRSADAIELVIEGTGADPRLVQSLSSTGWQGQLSIAVPNGLRLGPQRLSIPEAGLQLVTLTGGGSSYQIDVTPTPGLPLRRPVVSADGQNLVLTFAAPPQASFQTLRPNLNQPGVVPQPVDAPPLQPRAVAPPLGDMAVGTMMLRNTSYINLSGPRITMTLKSASSRDALMALARLGNYGFVFIDDAAAATGGNSTRQPSSVNSAASGSLAVGDPDSSPKVNIAFANEDYSRAVNTVLLASGLGARLEGRLIMAGKNIHSKSFGPRLSKVYRLNQVSPGSAADYLANLGASVTKTNTVSTAVSTGSSQSNAVQGAPSSSTTTSTTITSVESYGASMGPLLGLQATTDSRLRTITLIGDPALVAVAEQYLRQLDLRQRQVALSVKILDVTLNNDSQLANSFAFRSGSSFILSDNGSLRAVFGSMTPGGQANPGLAYPNNELLDEIRAVVTSSSTKVLASPTLILSENAESTGGGGRGVNSSGSSGGGSSGSTGGASSGGAGGSGGGGSIGRSNANEGFVTVGETVITGYSAVTNQTSTVCTPQKTDAGLSFGAKINKIDDNGFVTFSMSPEISAQLPGGSVPGCGPFFNIAKRRLDTGTLRVRDGQTLVLTGVINEDIQANVSKWPILGDLPIIGQFFRATGANRGKSELVILVTPRILREDDSADPYGYGYRPSSQEARQFMGGY